jgi:hypothetical protein
MFDFRNKSNKDSQAFETRKMRQLAIHIGEVDRNTGLENFLGS